MIKQTLYFSNPAYLSLSNAQLVIKRGDGLDTETRPIEDIGVILLDHPQITLTHGLINALLSNKSAIISCDRLHLPSGLMLPIKGHTEQSKRYRIQVNSSQALKNNLWQQTVIAKIKNQRRVLDIYQKPSKRLSILSKRVISGDPSNIEGQAAAYYWSTLLGRDFKRERDGEPPNGLLNYGYAILRSLVARALSSSGLMVTHGIHHRNKYNAYCLADDIMEPYRPFVDIAVADLYLNQNVESFLNIESKKTLLSIGQVDAYFGKLKRPLMVGLSSTTASLYHCYEGTKRKIIYPKIP